MEQWKISKQRAIIHHRTMVRTAQYQAAMSKDRLEVVFVLGSPGSGKGTVCKKIEEEFGYVHFSAGEVLRTERTNANSSYRDQIDRCYREDSLVPPDILCTLLEAAVEKSKSQSNKFLFDAFPINLDTLDAWDKSDLSRRMTLNFVLFLDCPQGLCERRILQRGAAGSGRDDDVQERLENRFKLHKKETVPVVEYFESQKLLRKVDASKSPEEVYREVRRAFQTGDKE